jgi:superfamily I DNA and/or RNA helicase
VIQDESSKATPAELVLPFVYGKRAIVIGDHRQLPPMLDQEEFEDTLEFADAMAKSPDEKQEIARLREFVETHFADMEISHFQKLYEHIDDSLKGTFNLQYRMHPDINEVIEQFYRQDGGLRCGLTFPIDLGVNDPDMKKPTSRYHGIDIPGVIAPNTHVLFVNTTSPEMKDGTSRVNYGEVETIDKLLSRMEQSESFRNYLHQFSNIEDQQIGIISFYGKQIKLLRSIAYTHCTLPIRVSTVDRFQGMERNIVIVSMVRSNVIQSTKNQLPNKKRYPKFGYPEQQSLGFAQSPNRLNVALSRAKRLLIVVGNRELFSSLEIYQRLFQTIEANPNNKVINQIEL